MAAQSNTLDSRKRKAIAALSLLNLLEDNDRHWKRGKTRNWIKRRAQQGLFNNLVRELSIEDTAAYKEMMRMTHEDFLRILCLIERDITPEEISGGTDVITSKARLTLTLRFLATGESYRSLSFQFRISKAAISYIVFEVCNAIMKKMQPMYLKVPETKEHWLEIASMFEKRWQYPHCLGAIDGKHIVMQPPAGAGSHFYNYKGTHSIVLLAIAGPNYECIYADVGTNGRTSDGGVWSKCSMLEAIEHAEISLPPTMPLPHGTKSIPFVFVADDAFPLKCYMMKPYPRIGMNDERRIYNYRHSRARRISENLFGIIANRWRIFRSAILLPPKTIETLLLATLCIHSFLRQSATKHVYCPQGLADRTTSNGDVVPGDWRKNQPTDSLYSLQVPLTGHNATSDAKQVRETLKDYFFNEGAVEWQWGMY